MEKTTKKPYTKPKIIHETKLEVRAGTVIVPGEIPFDPSSPYLPGGNQNP